MRDEREQRRGDGEARDRQPRGPEPLQRELGQRHGQPPRHAGSRQCRQRRGVRAGNDVADEAHEIIVGLGAVLQC